MGLADLVAEFIRQSLSEQQALELRRNELAERFGCAPSQISYVLSTRFSPEQGYIVESRRGGGGYIRIRRVEAGPRLMIMHALASVGSSIDAASAAALLTNLDAAGAITPVEGRLMAAALSERALAGVPTEQKGSLRAEVFKQMLLVCADTKR